MPCYFIGARVFYWCLYWCYCIYIGATLFILVPWYWCYFVSFVYFVPFVSSFLIILIVLIILIILIFFTIAVIWIIMIIMIILIILITFIVLRSWEDMWSQGNLIISGFKLFHTYITIHRQTKDWCIESFKSYNTTIICTFPPRGSFSQIYTVL